MWTPNADQFVNWSHGRISNFGTTRKRGSIHIALPPNEASSTYTQKEENDSNSLFSKSQTEHKRQINIDLVVVEQGNLNQNSYFTTQS